MTATVSGPRTVRAPRGSERSCQGWAQEAALRMLMNNLDPEVAERPDDLVVYGGNGRAARSWEAFDAIVRVLKRLKNDETLIVQSGKPVAVFKTHAGALICLENFFVNLKSVLLDKLPVKIQKQIL